MADSLFIGLVTYPGTRFPDAAGPSGLLSSLTTELESLGIQVDCNIIDQDLYEPHVLLIDRAAVERSISAELATEQAWYQFLNFGRQSIRKSLGLRFQYRKRRRALLGTGSPTLGINSPGVRMVRRLINIELAHMELLRQAVASEAGWVLILEDDAHCADPEALAKNLQALLAETSELNVPAYVNISESFSAQELGITHLLRAVNHWNSDHPDFVVYSSSLPVTNTVCATLYRRAFLVDLLEEMESIPLDPVLPIDWKLNLALMNLSGAGRIATGSCWTVNPAPIAQRSMA